MQEIGAGMPRPETCPFSRSLREKERKRGALPPRPPTKGDAICFGQRPAYAKVLVTLSNFRPFGIRDGCFISCAMRDNGLLTIKF